MGALSIPLLRRRPDFKITITGHSLGGGAGALLAILLKEAGYDNVVYVIYTNSVCIYTNSVCS